MRAPPLMRDAVRDCHFGEESATTRMSKSVWPRAAATGCQIGSRNASQGSLALENECRRAATQKNTKAATGRRTLDSKAECRNLSCHGAGDYFSAGLGGLPVFWADRGRCIQGSARFHPTSAYAARSSVSVSANFASISCASLRKAFASSRWVRTSVACSRKSTSRRLRSTHHAAPSATTVVSQSKSRIVRRNIA